MSVDSIVVNELPSQKPTTTLLHSSTVKKQYQHHMYNYWTLNERLRSKNEKLFKIQQASCRFAFYSFWLFVFAGIMSILVYRFTNDCPLATIDRRQYSIKCLKHVLFFVTICLSFIACSGIIYGTCRYFRSQPRQWTYNDECELRLIQNYDLLPTTNRKISGGYQTSAGTSDLLASTQQNSIHNDEHSNLTVTSLKPNVSTQRKIPPFTYEELPQTRSLYSPSLPALSVLSNSNLDSKSNNIGHGKSTFFPSSKLPLSSSQSAFPKTIISNIPNSTIHNDKSCKSTINYKSTVSTVPTSYTTCICGTDVWERQH